MAEHDQRFKQLLQEFFPEFLALFFPRQPARLDFRHIEWLDKELFPDPSQGDVYVLDLVARLRPLVESGQTSGTAEELVTLVYVEVESRDAVATFRRRMYQYYESLRRKYACPVLPVAVYLRVGLDGVGIDGYGEDYDDLQVLRFQYLYVGLPGLDAEQYVVGANWLGVGLSALMRVPRLRKAWLRSEALRRVLLECPEKEYRRFLLRECVEAYLELDEGQQREYVQILNTEPYREIRPMMTTTWEKGLAEGRAQGLEQGRVQGQRQLVRAVLEHQFGPLSPTTSQRLDAWPAERLQELLLAVLKAKSLQEVGLGGNGPTS
jgi:hypothetical protein